MIKDKERSVVVLEKAKSAYQWAEANPKVYYNQPEDIKTGQYEDNDVLDEFFWAKAELLIATGDNKYETFNSDFGIHSVASWNSVKPLGLFALASNKNIYKRQAKEALLKFADKLVYIKNNSANGTAMGGSVNDFNWGSNSNASNQGISLIAAYQITKDKKYLNAALGNVDYLFGRNGVGFCFLTGYGTKPTTNPHHRPSWDDKIDEPVPGLLAGGANWQKQDNCDNYEGNTPAATCPYVCKDIKRYLVDDIYQFLRLLKCLHDSTEVHFLGRIAKLRIPPKLSETTPPRMCMRGHKTLQRTCCLRY